MSLTYEVKTPSAAIIYGGDFSTLLALRPVGTTITGCGCSVAEASGDSAPGQLVLVGAPTFTGTVVAQKISGGIVGALYTLEFSATLSNTETITGTIDLPVGYKSP